MTDWEDIWPESIDSETGEDAEPEDTWEQRHGSDEGDGVNPYDEAEGPRE